MNIQRDQGKPWYAELRDLLGEKLRTDEATLEQHAGDKWFARALPEAVVFPTSTEEVASIMQLATRHRVPVTARGGGVGYVGGCVPVEGGIVLSLIDMNAILSIQPEDGMARVQAGVLTATLQDACTELGWFYPPDPASRKESSIGGNIATNAGGPRCLKYGVTRQYILGLTVVLADGRILRCGGLTHKNKQGFDLVGIFCGSEGLLGIVTEATLRLIPAPQARLAIQASFAQFQHAARSVQQVLQSGHLPAAMEITDAFTLAAARAYLGEGSFPREARGHIIIEIDGQRDALPQEAQAILDILRDCGALDAVVAYTPDEVEAVWKLRREFSQSLKETGLTKLNEDIVIPRSQLVHLVDHCESLQQRTGISIACFGHSGDGNIHTNIMIPRDAQGQERREEADAVVHEVFAWVLAHGGSITGEHGIGIAKQPWFAEAVGACAFDLHQQLKATLDPLHLLNPRKMCL